MLDHIRAVVLDWAGTTIDFGCCAPPRVFRDLFLSRGIEVSEAQARAPMGMGKREHIQAIAANPDIEEQWTQKYGVPASDADIEFLFREFVPLQKEILANYSTLIPGAAQAVQQIRGAGIAIGSSTGYTRELMDLLLPLAQEQGYRPDVCICSDDVDWGRPRPWMIYEALKRMNVEPVWQCVKVDDTPVGIHAGRNAGAWTVAVVKTSNEMGLSFDAFHCLGNEERENRVMQVTQKFQDIGADYVIDSIVDLPSTLEQIGQRIEQGELPGVLRNHVVATR